MVTGFLNEYVFEGGLAKVYAGYVISKSIDDVRDKFVATFALDSNCAI